MAKLIFSLSSHEEESRLNLAGSLSEGSSLPSSQSFSTFKKLTINLKDLTYLNSAGIKIWKIWLDDLVKENQDLAIHLRDCPSMFIENASLASILIPEKSIVESLFVPYYCEENDDTQYLRLERGQHYMETTVDKPAWNKVSEKVSINGKDYEIDVLTDSFFRFLKNR